jgi:hypothetical protein
MDHASRSALLVEETFHLVGVPAEAPDQEQRIAFADRRGQSDVGAQEHELVLARLDGADAEQVAFR